MSAPLATPVEPVNRDIEAGKPQTSLTLAQNPGVKKTNFLGRHVTDWSQGVSAVLLITAIFVAIYAFVIHQNLIGGLSSGIAVGEVVNFVREGQLGRWKKLTTQNQLLQKNVEDLQGEISTLKANEKILDLQVRKETEANQRLIASESQLKKDLATKLADFDRVNTSLERTEKELSELKPLLAKYQAQEKKIGLEEGKLNADINALAGLAAQTEKEKQAVAAETQDLSSAAARVHDANSAVTSDLKVLQELKAGVQALDDRVSKPIDPALAARLQTAEKRVESLTSLLQTIIGTLDQLSSKYVELKPLVTQLKAH